MRRSRIGMPPRPTGRGPRPEMRKGPNSLPSSHNDLPPATRLGWRLVSLNSLRHFWNRSLETDPENDVVATELAATAVDQHENRKSAQWTVLKPTEMKSTGGETLTVEQDGSIFVSGPNPDRAVYTLKFRTRPARRDSRSVSRPSPIPTSSRWCRPLPRPTATSMCRNSRPPSIRRQDGKRHRSTSPRRQRTSP